MGEGGMDKSGPLPQKYTPPRRRGDSSKDHRSKSSFGKLSLPIVGGLVNPRRGELAEPKRRYGAPLPGGNLDNPAKKSQKFPPPLGVGQTPWWHGYVTTFGVIGVHPDRDALSPSRAAAALQPRKMLRSPRSPARHHDALVGNDLLRARS